MQNDGNFCVYKGTGPNNNQGGVWCTMSQQSSGSNFFAIMQSDGNFCIYKGTGPNNNQGEIWCTMALNNLQNVVNDQLSLTSCGSLTTHEYTSSTSQELWSSSCA